MPTSGAKTLQPSHRYSHRPPSQSTTVLTGVPVPGRPPTGRGSQNALYELTDLTEDEVGVLTENSRFAWPM